MFRSTLTALALLSLSSMAQAHEVWVERDSADGPVRIYLGEPGDPLPEGGDPEFEKLKAPRLVPASQAAQSRKIGYIETTAAAGDIRVTDDSVFEPWGEEGQKQGIVYHARAGRSDTTAVLPLEIVPVAPGSDSFRLIRDGKPVPATKITVISPDKWSKSFTTDAQGQVSPSLNEDGRYILSATMEDKGKLSLRGKPVSTLYQTTTLTFIND